MKRQSQNRHRLKIPPQQKLMNLTPSESGLQVLKPLYLNVAQGSKLLKPIMQQENINTMDIAPTNTNTQDTAQATIPTKRSHHKKTTNTAPKVEISGLDTSAAKPKATRQPRVNQQKLTQVTAGVTSLYATIGIFAYARDQYDGLIIMTTAQDRAVELVNVAKHHKWLMDLLIRLTQSSDYVTLAIGHAGLVYALLAHHNQIPSNQALLAQFGYTEAQVAAKAAAMQPPQAPSDEEIKAQYAAMQQSEPEPANFGGTLYETGIDYDRDNTTTETNPPSVHRMDESTLGAR